MPTLKFVVSAINNLGHALVEGQMKTWANFKRGLVGQINLYARRLVSFPLIIKRDEYQRVLYSSVAYFVAVCILCSSYVV